MPAGLPAAARRKHSPYKSGQGPRFSCSGRSRMSARELECGGSLPVLTHGAVIRAIVAQICGEHHVRCDHHQRGPEAALQHGRRLGDRCSASALSAVGCTSIGGDSSALPWNADRVTMTSFAPLVSEIIPAVVNVSALQRPGKAAADESPPIGVSPVNSRDTASELPSSALDELLRRFFDDQQHRGAPKTPGLALGSGLSSIRTAMSSPTTMSWRTQTASP